MQWGYAHTVADILEMDEVFGERGSEIANAVTVVIDIVAVFGLGDRRSFHKLSRERLGSLTPRTFWMLGKRHLHITVRTGVVLEHHHIVVLGSLEPSSAHLLFGFRLRRIWRNLISTLLFLL